MRTYFSSSFWGNILIYNNLKFISSRCRTVRIKIACICYPFLRQGNSQKTVLKWRMFVCAWNIFCTCSDCLFCLTHRFNYSHSMRYFFSVFINCFKIISYTNFCNFFMIHQIYKTLVVFTNIR